jgi:hypothetical protein
VWGGCFKKTTINTQRASDTWFSYKIVVIENSNAWFLNAIAVFNLFWKESITT